PRYAEAYANLGTTYQAIAAIGDSNSVNTALLQLTHSKLYQQELVLLLQPQIIPEFVCQLYPSLSRLTSSVNPPSAVELAECYYRIAISICPEFWDASVNLAGLLTSLSRYNEALEVYNNLEEPFGVSYPTIELPVSDSEFVRIAMAIEPTNQSNSIKRRDLVYLKGNLFHAIGDHVAAKHEYLKALVVSKIDLLSVFNGIKVEHPSIDGDETVSEILMTVAKMYQDEGNSMAIMFYFASVSVKATPNTCNNLGILLTAQGNIEQAVKWYQVGLTLDSQHVHLYTNLGSALKDLGIICGAVECYLKAIAIHPGFWIALANLANLWKDMGKVEEAIILYRRALEANPDFIEAFCNLVYSLLFVCDWDGREENLRKVYDIVKRQLNEEKIPTVLPFHTFTYSGLTAWMIREISRRNAELVIAGIESSTWFLKFPKRPLSLLLEAVKKEPKSLRICSAGLERSLHFPYPYPPPITQLSPFNNDKIRIGYVSSDFVNHPLAHLMQSVFGMHNRNKFAVFCYSLSPSDLSIFRHKIESESDIFVDVSRWTIHQIVERIVADRIHILCNLNGYTRGARNEIFAARPAPIQMAFMGFAGTMGAGKVFDPINNSREARDLWKEGTVLLGLDELVNEWSENNFEMDWDLQSIRERWIDYMVVDEIVCPRKLVCGELLNENELDVGCALRGMVSKNSDENRVYTEAMIYMPQSFFVNDHKQGFREEEDINIENIVLNSGEICEREIPRAEIPTEDDNNGEKKFTDMLLDDGWDSEDELEEEERLKWRKEEIKRIIMRREIFPNLREDTVIFANFNQLYKVRFS
ncbi:hypothetical protein HK096_006053, partial [Nowakowskiella sp. JEL0078]